MSKQGHDICAKGSFELIAHTIASCFNPKIGERKTNIKFANSKILKAFCDCSHNFEYKKLRKKIIEANKLN